MQVEFFAGRDGRPAARAEGRMAFPERSGKQPQVGETWEVEIAGTNPAGTVYFLRLLSRQPQDASRDSLQTVKWVIRIEEQVYTLLKPLGIPLKGAVDQAMGVWLDPASRCHGEPLRRFLLDHEALMDTASDAAVVQAWIAHCREQDAAALAGLPSCHISTVYKSRAGGDFFGKPGVYAVAGHTVEFGAVPSSFDDPGQTVLLDGAPVRAFIFPVIGGLIRQTASKAMMDGQGYPYLVVHLGRVTSRGDEHYQEDGYVSARGETWYEGGRGVGNWHTTPVASSFQELFTWLNVPGSPTVAGGEASHA